MQSLKGIVIKSKTPQTVIVAGQFVMRHPKYKKIMTQTTKLAAHNELPDIKVGDKVKIVESRPYSKTKHFKVLEKI